MENNIKKIEGIIGYSFNNKALLTQAFTRKSFANENQGWEHNEMLEFIGDKVLDLVVVKALGSRYQFEREVERQKLSSIKRGEKLTKENFADAMEEAVNIEFAYNEGEMTEIKKQIVSTPYLSKRVTELCLGEYLLLSRGDEMQGVKDQPSVKEDLFEAIVGAVALDCGWDMTLLESFVSRLLDLEGAILSAIEEGENYISRVNDWYQKTYKEAPEYTFYQTDFDLFECSIEAPGFDETFFYGNGRTKKEAETLAARRLCEYIERHNREVSEITKSVGDFDEENAVSKLQILQDKKLISGLSYAFKQSEESPVNTGNPFWDCTCSVDGIDREICIGAATKALAKKAAAYVMLSIIVTGKDPLADIYDSVKYAALD